MDTESQEEIRQYLQKYQGIYSQIAIEEKLLQSGYTKEDIEKAYLAEAEALKARGGKKLIRSVSSFEFFELIFPLIVLCSVSLLCYFLAGTATCSVGR